MADSTSFRFYGNRDLAMSHKVDSKRLLEKIKEKISFNELDQLKEHFILPDGTLVTVQIAFGDSIVSVTSPIVFKEGEKPEQEIKKHNYVIMSAWGYRMFSPVGRVGVAPGSDFKQFIFTYQRYIVYDIDARAMAKIKDPFPEGLTPDILPGDDDAGEDGFIKFPCHGYKIANWVRTCALRSREGGQWTRSIIPLWSPVYYYSTIGYPSYDYGVGHTVTPDPMIGCNCPVPETINQSCKQYEWINNQSWRCGVGSVSDQDTSYADYILEKTGITLTGSRHCSAGGTCYISGTEGWGANWNAHGTRLSSTDSHFPSISNGIAGPAEVLNFDQGNYGTAILYPQGIGLHEKLQICRESKSSSESWEGSVSTGTKSVGFWGDEYGRSHGWYPDNTIFESYDQEHKTMDGGITYKLYCPLGNAESLEYNFKTVSLNQSYNWSKSASSRVCGYQKWPSSVSEHYTRSHSDIEQYGDGSVNYVNNWRRNLSVRGTSNVFVQLYMHHYVILNRTESGSNTGSGMQSTVNYSYTFGWGFSAQAEYVKNWQLSNPWEPESYIKYNEAKQKGNTEAEAWTFRTPEFEAAIEFLVQGVYDKAGVDTANYTQPYLAGEPLIMDFIIDILEGLDDNPDNKDKKDCEACDGCAYIAPMN